MNRVLTVVALLGLWAVGTTASAAEQTVTLAVDKMYCALCPVTVTKAMEGVEGVSAVQVDFATKQAVVTFEDTTTNWEQIASASTNAGYPATLTDES